MQKTTYVGLALLLSQISSALGSPADATCLDCAIDDTAVLLQVTKETLERNEDEDFKIKYTHLQQKYERLQKDYERMEHLQQKHERLQKDYERMEQENAFMREKLASMQSLYREKASDDVNKATSEIVLAQATETAEKVTFDAEYDDQEQTSVAKDAAKANGTNVDHASHSDRRGWDCCMHTKVFFRTWQANETQISQANVWFTWDDGCGRWQTKTDRTCELAGCPYEGRSCTWPNARVFESRGIFNQGSSFFNFHEHEGIQRHTTCDESEHVRC